MLATAGLTFSAALVAGTPLTDLGARLEVPVTREVVADWQAATLDGSLWSVDLVAPLDAGDYLLVWQTPDPDDFEAFVPLTVTAVPNDVAAITPTVAEVAALLIARTGRAIDDDVATAGTFTEYTNPTASKVATFATMAANDVRSRVGVAIPLEHVGQARGVATIYAAELAELSTVSEGASDEDRSVAPQLALIYRDRLADLKTSCRTGYLRLA